MKPCKICGEMIAKNAKVCPKCGAKQKGPFGIIVLAIIVILFGASILSNEGSKEDTTTETESPVESATITKLTEKDDQEKADSRSYTDTDITEMLESLEKNASAATDKYKGKYIAVTGELTNIDAQGSYICINDPSNKYSLADVQCYIKGNDEIANIVKTLTKGQTITVKGKVTDVGEILGYSMTIHEIIHQ